MDRLTKPMKGTPRGYIIAECENCTEGLPHCDEDSCYAESDIVGKLGNYEDAGLTPKEVAALKAENEQLKEILRMVDGACGYCIYCDPDGNSDSNSDFCNSCVEGENNNWQLRGNGGQP